jgi:hypothetical protein
MSDERVCHQKQTNPVGEEHPRKPYTTPLVREFGRVAALTMGGAPSVQSDHGNNAMRPGPA